MAVSVEFPSISISQFIEIDRNLLWWWYRFFEYFMYSMNWIWRNIKSPFHFFLLIHTKRTTFLEFHLPISIQCYNVYSYVYQIHLPSDINHSIDIFLFAEILCNIHTLTSAHITFVSNNSNAKYLNTFYRDWYASICRYSNSIREERWKKMKESDMVSNRTLFDVIIWHSLLRERKRLCSMHTENMKKEWAQLKRYNGKVHTHRHMPKKLRQKYSHIGCVKIHSVKCLYKTQQV